MEPVATQSANRPETCAPTQSGSHPHGHSASGPLGTAMAPGYTATFAGRAAEAARVRREITGYLGGCPVTEDMVLIASELASNAIMFFLLSSCVAITG